jgi:preprotein translocase subunit Sss1
MSGNFFDESTAAVATIYTIFALGVIGYIIFWA